jgi:hypothetical protein
MGLPQTWTQPRKGGEMCKLITWPDMSACIVVVPLDVSILFIKQKKKKVPLDVSSTAWCSVGVIFVDLNGVVCELGLTFIVQMVH